MNRQYSLLGEPNDRSLYEIGVLIEPKGRGGSIYMHEQIIEGDTIETSAPKNQFPMVADATHSILIAGGINIPHDCKRGECSMCLTRVLGGEPDHRDLCLSSEEKACSMCVCVSRAKGHVLTLDL